MMAQSGRSGAEKPAADGVGGGLAADGAFDPTCPAENAHKALLSLRGVELEYPGPPPVRVLGGVHLDVQANEYVAVMGQSGSGKSSLLNVLGLLVRPTGGEYWIDGHDTRALSRAELTGLRASAIGFVFQEFLLMGNRTAAENAALSGLYRGVRTRQRLELACQMLERVGLGHRAQASATTLSGGERQRVAIARALLGHPALLLCDEPTGSLDRSSTEQVLALLGELHDQGQTIVVVTHDVEVAARAQRRLVMSDGLLGPAQTLASTGR